MSNYNYPDGYSPDRCWFRNGYITGRLIGAVKDAVIGSDEWSEEDAILIVHYLGLKEGDSNIINIVSKIDDKLESVLNKMQDSSGTQWIREDEEFLMRMVGWEEYCILCAEISKGNRVSLGIKKVNSRPAHGYYINYENLTTTSKTAILGKAFASMAGE